MKFNACHSSGRIRRSRAYTFSANIGSASEHALLVARFRYSLQFAKNPHSSGAKRLNGCQHVCNRNPLIVSMTPITTNCERRTRTIMLHGFLQPHHQSGKYTSSVRVSFVLRAGSRFHLAKRHRCLARRTQSGPPQAGRLACACWPRMASARRQFRWFGCRQQDPPRRWARAPRNPAPRRRNRHAEPTRGRIPS